LGACNVLGGGDAQKDAVRNAWGDCIMQAITRLDDGKSDPLSVAVGVAPQCALSGQTKSCGCLKEETSGQHMRNLNAQQKDFYRRRMQDLNAQPKFRSGSVGWHGLECANGVITSHQVNYELNLALLMDTKDVTFIPHPLPGIPWVDAEGIAHEYYPDFYVPEIDAYVDPKNKYWAKKHPDKMRLVREQNPDKKFIVIGDEFFKEHTDVFTKLKKQRKVHYGDAPRFTKRTVSSAGRAVYNDGIRHYLAFPENADPSWNIGRLPASVEKRTRNTAGARWYNDGQKEYHVRPEDADPSWNVGSFRDVRATAWGETKTITEWTKDSRCPGIPLGALRWRLRRGWKPEQAIEEPYHDNQPKSGEWGIRHHPKHDAKGWKSWKVTVHGTYIGTYRTKEEAIVARDGVAQPRRSANCTTSAVSMTPVT
jgi:hypothetical protein